MHSLLTEQDLEFQQEVREFLTSKYTPELNTLFLSEDTFWEAIVSWHKILYEKGWAAPAWPKEYGGTGWTSTQQFIFSNEKAQLRIPSDTVPNLGIQMVGPLIYTFGTDEQKSTFLPRILSGDDWWCQGYSEPGSGSDLASLRTRADTDGSDYIVNGTKIWTTYARDSNWIFCLVRTDPKAQRKQEGISFLLIDMNSPGITVNPIKVIDGRSDLNETIFENVRVPMVNRIGDQDKGWTYAKKLLTFERTAIAGVASSKKSLSLIKRYASEELRNGKPLIEDPELRQRIADVELELMALEFTELRVLATVAAGQAPGAESSILKIKGTEMQQAVQTLMMDVAGLYGAVLGDDVEASAIGNEFANRARREYFFGRASTIYGGSTEVQKNIIAKAILGL